MRLARLRGELWYFYFNKLFSKPFTCTSNNHELTSLCSVQGKDLHTVFKHSTCFTTHTTEKASNKAAFVYFSGLVAVSGSRPIFSMFKQHHYRMLSVQDLTYLKADFTCIINICTRFLAFVKRIFLTCLLVEPRETKPKVN